MIPSPLPKGKCVHQCRACSGHGSILSLILLVSQICKEEERIQKDEIQETDQSPITWLKPTYQIMWENVVIFPSKHAIMILWLWTPWELGPTLMLQQSHHPSFQGLLFSSFPYLGQRTCTWPHHFFNMTFRKDSDYHGLVFLVLFLIFPYFRKHPT